MANDGKSVRNEQPETLPGKDVQGLRSSGRVDVGSQPLIDERTLSDLIERDAQDKADQKLREERAQTEIGHAYHRRITGHQARDDQSARILAGFDPQEREPQPAEFYSYHSPTLKRYGRF